MAAGLGLLLVLRLAGRAGGMQLPGRDKLAKAAMFEGVSSPQLADRVFVAAEQAVSQWDVRATEFLAPPDLLALQRVLSPLVDLRMWSDGGFSLAERRRLCFSRAGADGDSVGDDGGNSQFCQALAIEGNFLFDSATHRDFTEAVGAVVDPCAVGDVVVNGERGAHCVVEPGAVAERLCASLKSVKGVSVQARIIDAAELQARTPTTREVQSVEKSMRVDSVASAGMRLSRSKVAALVKSGDVQVNWRAVSSASRTLKPGDVVSIRGRGQLEVLTVDRTAKGSFRVHMRSVY